MEAGIKLLVCLLDSLLLVWERKVTWQSLNHADVHQGLWALSRALVKCELHPHAFICSWIKLVASSCLAKYWQRNSDSGSWGWMAKLDNSKCRIERGWCVFCTILGMWWFSLICYLVVLECFCKNEFKMTWEFRFQGGESKEKKNTGNQKAEFWSLVIFQLFFCALNFSCQDLDRHKL